MSLEQHIDVGTLLAELRMTRAGWPGAILLVEGTDDQRFWRTRLEASAEIVPCGGRSTLLDVVPHLARPPFSGVLAHADADWDRAQGTLRLSQDLVYTDAHDLETTLCLTRSLDKLLAIKGDDVRIRRFEERTRTTVRAALLARAATFGRLRWYNLRLPSPVPMDWLKVPRFLDVESWEIDTQELHRAAVSAGLAPDLLALERSLKALPDAPPEQICRGHDVVTLLTLGLRHVLGALKAGHGEGHVVDVLIAGCEAADIERLEMGVAFRQWEVRSGRPLLLTRR